MLGRKNIRLYRLNRERHRLIGDKVLGRRWTKRKARRLRWLQERVGSAIDKGHKPLRPREG